MAAPPSRRRASPPELPEELVEEILLRLPPDDPGCLFRVSLVCKAWGLAVSHPGFRRRFRDHHRTPPVLGFLHNWSDEHIPRFIPTTASTFEFSLAAPAYRSWQAIDYRHGRALFLSQGMDARELLLWEPTTGAQRRVPVPAAFVSEYPTAAVLCAAEGCDHRDCLGGHFKVVFVFTDIFDCYTPTEEYLMSACVYSSETDSWGEPTLLPGEVANFTLYSSVLVRNSLLYFFSDGEGIYEYDLARHSLTMLDTPDNSFDQKFSLMLGENGELVVSESVDQHLILWSRDLSGGTGARWVPCREIYLQNLLPDDALEGFVDVLGFADGANAIFVSTVAGLFMIELQSKQVRRVCDDHGYCNLIPVVGFYTPQSRIKVLGGQHHDPPLPWNPTKEEILKFAHELFVKGFKAMQEGNFSNASDCFSRAFEIRVLHDGKIAPQYASIFYKCGCALLCKARAATNPSGGVSKGAPNEEPVKITATTSKNDVGSSSASGCIVEHVPPSEGGDSEEGENLNHKDKEDCSLNMTGNEDGSHLHLAWKMLDIARVVAAKSPEKTMEKANIFYALAEVSMKRGDRDSAIGFYLEALTILEHLLRPDDLRLAKLNFHICLVFELASKVGDAIPYCAKAISGCKSRIQALKNPEEALLADTDGASGAVGHSGKFTLEDKISFLARILARFQKKLEELEQGMSTPSSGIDKITEGCLTDKS